MRTQKTSQQSKVTPQTHPYPPTTLHHPKTHRSTSGSRFLNSWSLLLAQTAVLLLISLPEKLSRVLLPRLCLVHHDTNLPVLPFALQAVSTAAYCHHITGNFVSGAQPVLGPIVKGL